MVQQLQKVLVPVMADSQRTTGAVVDSCERPGNAGHLRPPSADSEDLTRRAIDLALGAPAASTRLEIEAAP